MLRFSSSTAANTLYYTQLQRLYVCPQKIVLEEFITAAVMSVTGAINGIKMAPKILTFIFSLETLKLLFSPSFLHSIPDAQTFVPFSLLRSLTSNAQTNNSNSFTLLRSIPDFKRKNPSFHSPSFINFKRVLVHYRTSLS